MAACRSRDANGIKPGYVADVVASIRTLRSCAEHAPMELLRACAAALARGATDSEVETWKPMVRALHVVCGTDQGHPRILPTEVQLNPSDVAIYRRGDGRWVAHRDEAVLKGALTSVSAAYDAIMASFVTASVVASGYERTSSAIVDMARAVVSLGAEVESLKAQVRRLSAQCTGSGSVVGISSAVC